MDTIARVLAPKLGEALGQQFVVENRPGASGGVAAEALAGAQPDGHVLMLAESGTLALPSVNPKVTLDPVRSRDTWNAREGLLLLMGLDPRRTRMYISIRIGQLQVRAIRTRPQWGDDRRAIGVSEDRITYAC